MQEEERKKGREHHGWRSSSWSSAFFCLASCSWSKRHHVHGGSRVRMHAHIEAAERAGPREQQERCDFESGSQVEVGRGLSEEPGAEEGLCANYGALGVSSFF